MKRASNLRQYEGITLEARTKVELEEKIAVVTKSVWKVRLNNGTEQSVSTLSHIDNFKNTSVRYRKDMNGNIVLAIYERHRPRIRANGAKRRWTARLFFIPETKLQYANQYNYHFEIMLKDEYTLINA